ncbi:MAG: biopolymer transporter ExbD [Planctomycetota bacterium]
MRLPKRHLGGLGAPNITPLCDIMLSLLIFFMLVSRAGIETGADENLVLPEVLQGVKIESFGETVTLNVYDLELNGGNLVTTRRPLTSTDIELTAGGSQDELAEFLTAITNEIPNLKLIVRTDQTLEYRYVEPVLLAASQAQVESVNFAVVDASQGGGS